MSRFIVDRVLKLAKRILTHRGDLFAEQMKTTAPVIVFDDAPSQTQSQPQPQSNFYDATVGLLRLVMALLAVAMELGAGLALHEAWRMNGLCATALCAGLAPQIAAIRFKL